MIAIKYLELSQPLEVPTGIEAHQAVRFYCTWYGQVIGQVDIWHKGGGLTRQQLVDEICARLGPLIHEILFNGWPQTQKDVYFNLYRQVQARLGLKNFELPPPGVSEAVMVPPDLTASICITTFDRPDDLRQCLQRLLDHQTQVPFEIVVADNNPASGLTEPVVRAFPGVVYVKEPRPGIYYGRNAAALHANGDIIVCIDDDAICTEGWLDYLIAPYADPQVMSVSGMILPVELEHESQYWFEVYGGLPHSYRPARFDRTFFDDPGHEAWLPLWEIGVTANQSYRACVFADPRVGPFGNVLRLSGGDQQMVYRMLKHNMTIVYEPRARVLHRHRTTMEGLARQLYKYGRGMITLQLFLFFREGDIRGLKSLPGILRYDCDRLSFLLGNKARFPYSLLARLLGNRKGLYYGLQDGRDQFPLRLAWAETRGHLAGVFSLLRSFFVTSYYLGGYNSEMFARRYRGREAIRPLKPGSNTA